MSFEGEASVVALPLLPIAVVGAAVAAVGVAAAYAAYKSSCLVGRGALYTAREARTAWQHHAAQERARAVREAQAAAAARRRRVAGAVAAARVTYSQRRIMIPAVTPMQPQMTERLSRSHVQIAAVEAELRAMEHDPVLVKLVESDALRRVEAELTRSRAAVEAGDAPRAEEYWDAAEAQLTAAREHAFRALEERQRTYLAGTVAGALEKMGYGRPHPEALGSWTVLRGDNGVRAFTVAITEDLRLVFDLGHQGFSSVAPCRAEVERFLSVVGEGATLQNVQLTPTHPQAVQEQTALALLQQLRAMGADVIVEQDGAEVVLSASFPTEQVTWRVGLQGETAREQHETSGGPHAATTRQRIRA